MTFRIPHVIAKELCNIHDFLRVSKYFTISLKLYKKSEAVVRLVMS